MEKKNPCGGCDLCCRHIALEIDAPEEDNDFENVRWFLLHKDVWVFIDHDDSWNIQVNTPCEKLKDGLCTYYEERPQICRDYDPSGCERYGDGNSYKLLWKSIEDFEDWVKAGGIIPEYQED